MAAAFYDLHAHILPGVDDGPKTMEDSVKMARIASEDGIRGLLATPHSKDVNEDHSVDYITSLINDLGQELRGRGIQLELFLGMENYLVPDLAQQVSQGRALTLNGSRYILVELPFTAYPTYVNDVLFHLQLQGLIPVIAHPERNTQIQKNPSILASLVERGVLAQITAASILGGLGADAKRSSRTLLRMGLVHVIASDTHHHLGPRIPVLSRGMTAAAKIVGPERARSMVEGSPKALLEDSALEIESPCGMEPSRPWWHLW